MPAARGQSYSDVLSRALEDITTNGYDSAERIAYWVSELEKAAERTMRSGAQVDQGVRDALSQIYRRMVERGVVLKYHSGADRFTLERLRHQLRLELDRSILASVNLIKINREKRVRETLQRFQGWATSIPAGGSKAADKKAERENLKKPISQIKFEQRRVEIDQGHKLVSNINRIIATDGGAIAGRWHSNWKRPGYDYREPHKDRDFSFTGNVYLLRNSWADKQGFVKPMRGVSYTDQITQPAEEPYCSCHYEYVYALRDLPAEMLTKKGEQALMEARAKIKQMMLAP